MRRPSPPAVLLVALLSATIACEHGPAPATPQPSAGSSDRPREVNLVMHDYSFAPDPVDLIPGETIRLQVVNAGLDWHEAVVGDQATQDAWEVAEGATVGAPPGPTPVVSVAPALAGLRIVVPSAGRVDAIWTVPSDPVAVLRLLIGCHIPGHYAKGMKAAVRVPGIGSPGSSR